MSIPFSQTEIESQIHKDTQVCQALLDLLVLERQALKSKDLDQLEKIINEKAEHLLHLEHSAKLRTLWSEHLAAQTPEAAWNDLLKQCNDSNLQGAWKDLKVLFKECQTANEINGKIMSRNHQTFSRLLAIFRGQSNAPGLYNSSGSSASGSSPQIVGEA